MSAGQHAQLLALAPPGGAFPREPDSVWGRTLRPLADEQARIEAEGSALLAEVDPGGSLRLLEDYERVLGEDPCLGPAAALPLSLRQSSARSRWTVRGGASAGFFVGLAAALGLVVEVIESTPFEAGVTEAGLPLVPAGGRFEWIVRIVSGRVLLEGGGRILTEDGRRLSLEVGAGSRAEFESGASSAGSPLGEWTGFAALECVIRRSAPAHTRVFFSYGG